MAGEGYQASVATRSGSALKRAQDKRDQCARATSTPDNQRALAQAERDLSSAKRDFDRDYSAYERDMREKRQSPLSRDRFIN